MSSKQLSAADILLKSYQGSLDLRCVLWRSPFHCNRLRLLLLVKRLKEQSVSTNNLRHRIICLSEC